jgi:phosphoglycolate phosphatase-like HAD superfamily hydrolase
MQIIEAILFEPVGCLAEFPAESFHEIAVRFFGKPEQKKKASKSGSRSYWHLLNLMQTTDRRLDESERRIVEALEVQAVEAATVYEDVLPALSELKAMGIELFIASSLSNPAIARFVEKCSPGDLFSAVWNRDNAGGIKAAPIAAALEGASLNPAQVMFLTDTAEGLKVAKSVGVNSILMMNDPDEAMRLAMRDPSGGIVSLHELPDFVRLVAAENANRLLLPLRAGQVG